jgi:hypothetical protein
MVYCPGAELFVLTFDLLLPPPPQLTTNRAKNTNNPKRADTLRLFRANVDRLTAPGTTNPGKGNANANARSVRFRSIGACFKDTVVNALIVNFEEAA